MQLEGKVVIVTGSSRGIGAATARLLAAHGASVAVNYFLNRTAAEDVVAEITAAGGRAIAVEADVRQPEPATHLISRVEADLGPVDILVLNASIGFPVKPFRELTWAEFESKLNGEIRAAFFPVKAALPGMLARKQGHIIGISSGLSRRPGEGFSAHSTAKAGLDALMQSLAFELGPQGIRVNTIAPGLTLTDATKFLPENQKQALANVTPMRRNALPEDVAGAVLALSLPQCGFVTGAWIPVSGGLQMG